MKRRLSERICACKPWSGASLWELLPNYAPVPPSAGTGTLQQSLALPGCPEPRRGTGCAAGTSLPAPRRGAGLRVCKYIIYSLYYPPPLFIV